MASQLPPSFARMAPEKIMSHTLEIPDTLYAALKKAADASGLTPVDWIATHLSQPQGAAATKAEQVSGPRTLADLFAGRVGRIQSGGKERLSEECGAKFTNYLEENMLGETRTGGTTDAFRPTWSLFSPF